MDLSDINFSNADLRKCNMEYVVMHGADLSGALLSGARLNHADIRESRLDGVYMNDVKLGKTKIDLEQAVVIAECLGGIVG
ncbi:MAG: pentapeptide repeat-containing protein [Clostridiales bacterium]|nr:pentapeptide repeat-containing protein [Clostridiales bacterium]